MSSITNSGNKSKFEDLIHQVHRTLRKLQKQGYVIGFQWVPAHFGIQRNEKADRTAKKALEKVQTIKDIRILKADIFSQIKKQLQEELGQDWKEQEETYHYEVMKEDHGKC